MTQSCDLCTGPSLTRAGGAGWRWSVPRRTGRPRAWQAQLLRCPGQRWRPVGRTSCWLPRQPSRALLPAAATTCHPTPTREPPPARFLFALFSHSWNFLAPWSLFKELDSLPIYKVLPCLAFQQLMLIYKTFAVYGKIKCFSCPSS